MAFFITQRPTDFLGVKADEASFVIELPPDRLVRDMEDPAADETWINVSPHTPGKPKPGGWVKRVDLIEAGPGQPPRVELSPDIFVAECVSRAWTSNLLKDMAPFYVDADYLIALALIQSGMTNPTDVGPNKRTGPFGITADEWKAFTDAPFDEYKYKDYELQLPLFQVACAAWQMHSDAKALSAKWQEKGVGTVGDPYLPRFGELLRCRLMGVDLAFAMQVKLKDDLGSQMLPAFFQEMSIKEAEAAALMTDRCAFMRAGGAPKGDPFSLQVFNDKCNELLDKALKEAFALIQKFVPEAVEQATGTAPWMKFARQERDAGISESTTEGRQKIPVYFQSTGFKQGTAADKWCAAFVSWCMDQCKGKVAASFNAFRNEAARSAKWREWGDTEVSLKSDPPVGAVVVLSPSKKTDEISHVGFFIQYQDDKRKVTILGGNQSNEVNETNFDAEDVVEIRWLQTAQGESKPVAGSAVPDATTDDLLTLARTIFGEARGFSTEALQDVASVILNRARNRFRGKSTVAGVCLDPKQFSCWNLGDPNRPKMLAQDLNSTDKAFKACLAVAEDALKGAFPDLTRGALHYHAKSMKKPPFWVAASPDAQRTHTDDAHFFYVGIR